MTSITVARRLLATALMASLLALTSMVAPAASASQRPQAEGQLHGSCRLRHCSGDYWSRAATTTDVGVASRLVRVGAGEVATIAVRSRGAVQVTGSVTIASPGHVIRRVALLNGRAALVLPTTRPGIYPVTTTYRGDARHLPSVQTCSYIVTEARTVTATSLRLASASPEAGSQAKDGSYSLELLGLLGFGLASAAAVSTVLNRRRSRGIRMANR